MAETVFFVAGITGHVGGAAAQQLLDEGFAVRTLARDPAKAAAWAAKGVDVRQGDWTDAAGLAGALEGVAGAFVMVPPFMAPEPGYPESKAVIASLLEALKQKTPPRVVALSSIGSEQRSGLGLITATHLLEQALSTLGTSLAFVRAGGFFENFAYGPGAATHTGTLPTLLTPTDRRVPMIASHDIGLEVAKLLSSPAWTGQRVIELGSDVSPDEIAAVLTELLGKPVAAQAVPRDQWGPMLEHMGIPAGKSGAFEEMEDSFNSGWIHFGVRGTEPVAGTVTPREFFGQLMAQA